MKKMQNIFCQPVKSEISYVKGLTGILLILLVSISTKAQNRSYSQLGNELQFARAINDRWAAELYLGGTFSNTPYESKVLKTNIQRYFFAWGHYYYSPRWKFSSSFAW